MTANMASKNHLEILAKGVKAWNRWRDENLDIRPNLISAELISANLMRANLDGVNLSGAELRGADLTGAYMPMVDLSSAKLRGADLSGATYRSTVFVDVDLSTVKGLNKGIHEGPSHIGIDTVFLSSGKIPDAFLRGAGVP